MNETFISFYLAKGRVHIFPSALHGIGDPPFIRFLLSKDGKTMIMEPYDHKEFPSMRVPKSMYKESEKRAQMEISCVPFSRMLAKWLNWEKDGSYRIPGKILPVQKLVLFDLEKTYSIHETKKEVDCE